MLGDSFSCGEEEGVQAFMIFQVEMGGGGYRKLRSHIWPATNYSTLTRLSASAFFSWDPDSYPAAFSIRRPPPNTPALSNPWLNSARVSSCLWLHCYFHCWCGNVKVCVSTCLPVSTYSYVTLTTNQSSREFFEISTIGSIPKVIGENSPLFDFCSREKERSFCV